MTKQEVIQQAYIEYWDQVKTHVREDGTIHERYLMDSTGHLGDCIELERVYGVFYRPKSLNGLETNNGWIKIESEEDLPKEDIDAVFFIVSNGDQYIGEFKSGHSYFKSEYGTIYDHEVTHYQPVVEPKMPIY